MPRPPTQPFVPRFTSPPQPASAPAERSHRPGPAMPSPKEPASERPTTTTHRPARLHVPDLLGPRPRTGDGAAVGDHSLTRALASGRPTQAVAHGAGDGVASGDHSLTRTSGRARPNQALAHGVDDGATTHRPARPHLPGPPRPHPRTGDGVASGDHWLSRAPRRARPNQALAHGADDGATRPTNRRPARHHMPGPPGPRPRTSDGVASGDHWLSRAPRRARPNQALAHGAGDRATRPTTRRPAPLHVPDRAIRSHAGPATEWPPVAITHRPARLHMPGRPWPSPTDWRRSGRRWSLSRQSRDASPAQQGLGPAKPGAECPGGMPGQPRMPRHAKRGRLWTDAADADCFRPARLQVAAETRPLRWTIAGCGVMRRGLLRELRHASAGGAPLLRRMSPWGRRGCPCVRGGAVRGGC